MLNRKQIAVIGLVVVLTGLLLSLNIKGLVKENGQEGAATAAASSPQTLTIESVSEAAHQGLSENLARPITELENSLKSASGGEKLAIQKELAQKWDDVNQPAPAAMYYELVAEREKGFDAWLKAADLYTSAYEDTQDSLMQPALVKKAIHTYQKALELKPNSLEAKTGLGAAYVNDGSNPMQGIQLLLAVVKEDPQNVKANLNLGLFSMKSGQFDKAVSRFKTVIEKEPGPEVWFYLASSYENLGMKAEAIAAYEKSKELAANPSLSSFVDQKVKELSK